MTNTDFHARRTELSNTFAAAGAELLDYMRCAGALAAIPNTQQYVVAGDIAAIRAQLDTVAPQRRMRHGDRPELDLYFGPEAGQARRWAALITSAGHGILQEYGTPFEHAQPGQEVLEVMEILPGAATANKAAEEGELTAYEAWLETKDEPNKCCRESFMEGYRASRQVAIPTWQERQPEHARQIGSAASQVAYMEAEIRDLRAALSRQVAASTVLTDERISAGARWLSNHQADECGVDRDDNWKVYGGQIIEEFRQACEVAFGSPVEAQAGQVAVPEWISIDDALPANAGPILVTNNINARNAFGSMSHVWMSMMVHRQDDGSHSAFAHPGHSRVEGITHWMQLPPSPAKESK